MKLSSSEKETIITFNEAEPYAEIFTYNRRMKNELDRFTKERPGDVQFLHGTSEGGKAYRCPKKWVKIRASRVLSEEQRSALVERAHKMRIGTKNS